MRWLVLCFFISSCSTLSTILDPKTYEDEKELVEPDEDDPDFFIPDDQIALKPVLAMHFACCADLCKGRQRVLSVLNEAETPYIRCNCTSGKSFRVTRTRIANNAKKKKRR